MANDFKVEGFSLEDLLANKKMSYQIPSYQRPYAWDKDQISDLIEDLTESYCNGKEGQYFCGSLVIAKGANSERYDIIDGQQRLTTFTILACVIRDFYIDNLGAENKDRIQDSIYDKYDKDKHKLKFLTDERYQTTFESSVLRENVLQERLKEVKKPQDIKDNRYLQNAYYLKERLKEAISENNIDINDFVSWLYTKVILTRIECPDEESAIRIFNVLNDRGIPLSPVDILKSSLMQSLDKERREAFKTTWQEIMSNLKTMGFSMYDTLNAYFYYAIADNPKGRLDKELKTYFEKTKQDSIAIIEEIRKFAHHYIEMINAKDKYIYCLRYLPNQIYWRSILCAAKMVDYKEYNKLKELLMAYYYQNLIGMATANRFKQVSFNILKAVKDNKSIDEIKNIMRENLKKYGTTKDYKEWLDDADVYDLKWVKPTLLLLEYFSKDDEIGFIEMDNKLHTEHILPRTPNDDWKKIFSDEERDSWTNAIANLTLLKFKKNIQAQNKSYEEKRKIYLNDDVSTSFNITQDIFKHKKWNAEALEMRENEIKTKIAKHIDIF
ncbi:hypothetical protein XJ32_03310 [Helicobacter bilis]|uniref:DUF262 domain-containing protein n=1 Tax=Helicobacter bilis TaxID=37372 RepID=A0A1Q2LFU5_9HELI|nr:DUF262 domain-containing protein [Helicobacter bilis]AQQ59290.1 hypothetical protein XJ32_03310 [Helicobacter bilis]